jgi:hypothetical protein
LHHLSPIAKPCHQSGRGGGVTIHQDYPAGRSNPVHYQLCVTAETGSSIQIRLPYPGVQQPHYLHRQYRNMVWSFHFQVTYSAVSYLF